MTTAPPDITLDQPKAPRITRAPSLSYEEFVAAKVDFDSAQGFEIDPADLHPLLKPHQRDVIAWALRGGRRAIFAAFGLGKTFMQLEVLRHCVRHTDGMALVVLPLGVRTEFALDAAKLGIEVTFIRSIQETSGPGIYLANYETVRDGKLDPAAFDAVSLDEASILRSFGSKTYQAFLAMFANVRYRFVATATPSPNRYKELIHYAGYLGIMDTGQALTRFFQRDSTQANNLTLYPHKEREFWLWLNTWACFLQSPADLGHDATGYDLPDLEVDWVEVGVDHSQASEERDGQGVLYRGGALDLKGAAKEKRTTIADRVAALMQIVDRHAAATVGADGGPADQIVLWCTLNDEQAAIEQALRARGLTYSSVHGGLDPDEAEDRLLAWRRRETYALIGKPVMLGQGMNLQQANTSVFVGIDHKFNDLIQAIHRIQRFGQTRACRAHLIHTEAETEIKRDLLEKWGRHKELTANMTAIIREHGLNSLAISEELQRAIGVERIEASGEGWLCANNDTVAEARDHIADDSVGLIVTSIPFGNHYEYTPNYNDFGHTDGNDHFWAQMDYLTPQLYRILAPGRVYACHVKDRINFGNVTGAGIPTIDAFHAEAMLHGRRHGFDLLGVITIVTDVVRENNQTYRLSYSEQVKDATKMGVGCPEYVILFHKPQSDRSRGYADEPVRKVKATSSDETGGAAEPYTLARWQIDAHALWRSSGDRHLTPEELAALPLEMRSRLFTEQTLREIYSYADHVRVGEQLAAKGALPSTFMALAPGSADPFVWHDVNRMHTLNSEQSRRAVEKHICPLQIDIVDRLIYRFSNPGDLIYDPFGGLSTVAVRALRLGRRGRTVELNPNYWADGVKYCQAEARSHDMPSLFDLIDAETGAA